MVSVGLGEKGEDVGSFDEKKCGSQCETAESLALPACAESDGEGKAEGTLVSNFEEGHSAKVHSMDELRNQSEYERERKKGVQKLHLRVQEMKGFECQC